MSRSSLLLYATPIALVKALGLVRRSVGKVPGVLLQNSQSYADD